MENDFYVGKLARYGVNILDLKGGEGNGMPIYVLYEFRWRPKPGQSLWTKSAIIIDYLYRDPEEKSTMGYIVERIMEQVQKARTDVEGRGYGTD